MGLIAIVVLAWWLIEPNVLFVWALWRSRR